MTSLQRSIDLLDSHHIHYTHTRHANAYRAREVAAAEHVPPYRLAKTIIFCGDSLYAMAVLPADCSLDVDELTANLGLGRVRLATESEIVSFPIARWERCPHSASFSTCLFIWTNVWPRRIESYSLQGRTATPST